MQVKVNRYDNVTLILSSRVEWHGYEILSDLSLVKGKFKSIECELKNANGFFFLGRFKEKRISYSFNLFIRCINRTGA